MIHQKLLVFSPFTLHFSRFTLLCEGGTEKHLRDIAGILAVSSGQIEHAILDKLIAERGLEREWGKANNSPD